MNTINTNSLPLQSTVHLHPSQLHTLYITLPTLHTTPHTSSPHTSHSTFPTPHPTPPLTYHNEVCLAHSHLHPSPNHMLGLYSVSVIPWLLTCGLLCTLCPTIPGCLMSGNYEGVTQAACPLGETFTLYMWEIFTAHANICVVLV